MPGPEICEARGMTPQSRRREPAGGGGQHAGRAAAGSPSARSGSLGWPAEPPPNALFAEMLRAARELLAVRSPLDAELMVSELLGTWWGQAGGRGGARRRAEIDALIGENLVRYAARQASPAALALLSGIACLGSSRQAAEAERAALALMDQGVARPAWAEHVGAVEAEECYLNSDGYGDRDEVVCLFSYAGREQHALVVVVDYNAGGLARDGWVTSQVAKLLDYCRDASSSGRTDGGPARGSADRGPAGGRTRDSADRGPGSGRTRVGSSPLSGPITRGEPAAASPPGSFRQIHAADARRILATALTATETATDPPVSASFPSYHAFLRARVRTLPPTRPAAVPDGSAILPLQPGTGVAVPGRRQLWRKDQRAALVAQFLASDDAEEVSDRQAASRCADHIVDYGCDRDFGRPLRVSPDKAETFLLDWLPRKVVLSKAEQEAMPHVLLAWIRWAGSRTGLAESAVRGTLDAVFDAMRTFATVYRDPASFGLEPGMVDRLLPDGDLEALARRLFAVPLLRGSYLGTDLSTLKPGLSSDRRTLLAADHDGQQPSAEHLDRHVALADRLWRGDPPELWEAAQRLLDLGRNRHDILHLLMDAIATAGPRESDIAAALASLPSREP
jgi:hypothetical protein